MYTMKNGLNKLKKITNKVNSSEVELLAPKLIIKRTNPDPHYEIHYSTHVEYWDTSLTVKQGESEVHVYREQ